MWLVGGLVGGYFIAKNMGGGATSSFAGTNWQRGGYQGTAWQANMPRFSGANGQVWPRTNQAGTNWQQKMAYACGSCGA